MIVNLVNGKFYVGSSIRLYERFCRHLIGAPFLGSEIVANAVHERSEYGLINFAFVVLEFAPDVATKEDNKTKSS